MRRKREGYSSIFAHAVLVLAFIFAVLIQGQKAEAGNVGYGTYMVNVQSGYLALRSEPAYNASNEKGRLYNGDMVEVVQPTGSGYAYVYAPGLYMYGYVNDDYLVLPFSGYYYTDVNSMTVSVSSGYLALRTAKSYDYANEIGKLYTGDVVQVLDASDYQYWYVYAPRLDLYGYVNKDYLYGSYPSGTAGPFAYYDTMTVGVASGYLALRTAKAYDAGNEIGKLYTGDTVQVIDSSDYQYWYVYAPRLGRYGFVNRDYLYGSVTYTGYTDRTVYVASGYLALRSAKAYDSRNEIGKLYTSDVVQVIDTADPSYWYVYAYRLGLYGYVNSSYLY